MPNALQKNGVSRALARSSNFCHRQTCSGDRSQRASHPQMRGPTRIWRGGGLAGRSNATGWEPDANLENVSAMLMRLAPRPHP